MPLSKKYLWLIFLVKGISPSSAFGFLKNFYQLTKNILGGLFLGYCTHCDDAWYKISNCLFDTARQKFTNLLKINYSLLSSNQSYQQCSTHQDFSHLLFQPTWRKKNIPKWNFWRFNEKWNLMAAQMRSFLFLFRVWLSIKANTIVVKAFQEFSLCKTLVPLNSSQFFTRTAFLPFRFMFIFAV